MEITFVINIRGTCQADNHKLLYARYKNPGEIIENLKKDLDIFKRERQKWPNFIPLFKFGSCFTVNPLK
jgi:hypothetical protein